eukprot:COSAG04_NODE_24228_length_325_cov_0.548673_1_plen_47_part_01
MRRARPRKRPEAKNAVNGEVSHQMHSLMEKFEADDDLWVGVGAARDN